MLSKHKHSPDVERLLKLLNEYGLNHKNDNFISQIHDRMADPRGFITVKQKRVLMDMIDSCYRQMKIEMKHDNLSKIVSPQLKLLGS